MISLTQMGKLFSIVIGLDQNSCIRFASETLSRHMYEPLEGKPLLDLFALTRPATVETWADIDQHIDSLFLLTGRHTPFAIRGQLFKPGDSNELDYVFCGSPWLTWINDNSPQVRLGMSDFAPQDSQLDQLFLMTTEKRMVGDLERLNADLKQAKRQTEEAEAAKAALFARMSHEMRTPLNGVISALSLMEEGALDIESREILRLAQSSSLNLLQVINYVLDVSRLEAGGEEAENIQFDVEELIQDVGDIVRARAVEKGLTLRCVKAPELGASYLGDAASIRQCLLNLVTNAIKFTESGSVTLRALEGRDQEGETRVRFEVEDTGVGIAPGDRNRIFEPFWTSVPSGEAGTGLGLDIVRRNVERLGGSVGVVSATGEGALFWVDIPLEPAGESGTTLPALADTDGAHFRGTVLLVDDNRTNRILGEKILQSLGADVITAESGSAALDICGGTLFDLVLMDISMPDMDGVECAAALRECYDAEAMPIVALTAYASSRERERCLAVGMNGYLTKPIVREQLVQNLARYLQVVTDERSAVPKHTATVVLNEETLSALRSQIGDKALEVVVGEFLREAEQRLNRYGQALERSDWYSLQQEVHTLGSTSLSLGLDAAGQSFRALEAQLLEGDPPDVAAFHEASAKLHGGISTLRKRLAS